MTVHEGHRSRVRERFKKEGMDNFQPHEVLEFLLFYSNARGDTNVIAHNLINRFGTLARVFDAPMSELTKVDGVGEISATLIKMIPQIARRYMISLDEDSDNGIFNDVESVRRFLIPLFVGKTSEHVYLVSVDSMSRPIDCTLVSQGSVNMSSVDIRKMVEVAIASKASFAMLAHNHPNGYAIPSDDDIIMTEKISSVFKSIGIRLLDHLIVVNDTAVSLLENKYLVCGSDGVLRARINNYDDRIEFECRRIMKERRAIPKKR